MVKPLRADLVLICSEERTDKLYLSIHTPDEQLKFYLTPIQIAHLIDDGATKLSEYACRYLDSLNREADSLGEDNG